MHLSFQWLPWDRNAEWWWWRPLDLRRSSSVLLLELSAASPAAHSDPAASESKWYNKIEQYKTEQSRAKSEWCCRFSQQLTSSLCSSFCLSSACLSLSFCWASSFSFCRLSCCSCCSLRRATPWGAPGGADPRTAAAGRCPDWTVGREKTNTENQINHLNSVCMNMLGKCCK